jgi:hypothetical protein
VIVDFCKVRNETLTVQAGRNSPLASLTSNRHMRALKNGLKLECLEENQTIFCIIMLIYGVMAMLSPRFFSPVIWIE